MYWTTVINSLPIYISEVELQLIAAGRMIDKNDHVNTPQLVTCCLQCSLVAKRDHLVLNSEINMQPVQILLCSQSVCNQVTPDYYVRSFKNYIFPSSVRKNFHKELSLMNYLPHDSHRTQTRYNVFFLILHLFLIDLLVNTRLWVLRTKNRVLKSHLRVKLGTACKYNFEIVK